MFKKIFKQGINEQEYDSSMIIFVSEILKFSMTFCEIYIDSKKILSI
jgi:hypothetical protein